MHPSRKSPQRLIAVMVVLLVAVAVWMVFPKPSTTPSSDESVNARNKAVSSAAEPMPADASRGTKEKAPSDASDAKSVDVGWARGAGYALGNRIKDVFSRATRNPEGFKRLDLSSISSDWTKERRTVALEDPATPSRLRAEYFAAILCSSLDVPTNSQAALADLLEPIYERDRLDQNEDAREQNRIELAHGARDRLFALLPKETHDRFREMTALASFPFHAASFGADSIDSDRATASGHAMAVFRSDGSFEVIAERMSPKLTKKRSGPTLQSPE